MGIFSKFSFGLKKTRDKMNNALDDMFDSYDDFEDGLFTELEEILVMGDVGMKTAFDITEELKARVAKQKIKSPSEAKGELMDIVADMLYGGEDMGLVTIPSIILMIGVNGVGKTTTIGKMAAMYKSQGKKVILGAADTFRAAAIEQLEEWANRAGVDIVKHKEGADPAAVIFDTIAAGKAREADIIICDTAGRLHNKKNLMEELAKIYRVIDKQLPYSDREVLLVLDATTGQNAVNQAREFKEVADITGIVLTKLDGTARGGVVLAIKNELKIPVKFVGVGEKLDDLQPFNPRAFANGLFAEITDKHEEEIERNEQIAFSQNTYDNLADGGDDAEELDMAEVFADVADAFAALQEETADDTAASDLDAAAQADVAEETEEVLTQEAPDEEVFAGKGTPVEEEIPAEKEVSVEAIPAAEEEAPAEVIPEAEEEAPVETIPAAEEVSVEAIPEAEEEVPVEAIPEEKEEAPEAVEFIPAAFAAAADIAPAAPVDVSEMVAAAQKSVEAEAEKPAQATAAQPKPAAPVVPAQPKPAERKDAPQDDGKKKRRGLFGLFGRNS